MPDVGTTTYIAEVYRYNDTYLNSEKNFSIDVLIRDTSSDTTREILNVVPLNNNIKQLPILGENVLIFLGYSPSTNNVQAGNPTQEPGTIRRTDQWYYLNPVNIRFNVTENISFSNSSGNLFPGDKTNVIYTDFVSQANEVSIAPLQPYAGDVLVEGRWGNTIRLGSTSKKNNKTYAVDQPWDGVKASDSIIILSNSKRQPKSDNTKFRVEDIKQDRSCLYLTTTQKLTNFKLGTTNIPNRLVKFQSESQFIKSQFIGVADRVVLQAKTDIVVLDSPRAIVLNTTGFIKLGNDTADQPLPHGWVLYTIIQKILDQLSIPIQVGSGLGTFLSFKSMEGAQSEMKNLLNKNFYITKHIR